MELGNNPTYLPRYLPFMSLPRRHVALSFFIDHHQQQQLTACLGNIFALHIHKGHVGGTYLRYLPTSGSQVLRPSFDDSDESVVEANRVEDLLENQKKSSNSVTHIYLVPCILPLLCTSLHPSRISGTHQLPLL